MHIGGVGNSHMDSHSSTHQVTGCLHEHSVQKPTTGAARMASGGVSSTPASNAAAEAAREGFSVVGVLRDVVATGRHLLRRLWNGGDGAGGAGSAANGSNGANALAMQEQVLAQIGEEDISEQAAGLAGQMAGQNAGDNAYSQQTAPDADIRHNPRVAAASVAVQTPQNMLQNNPYFTTTSDPGKVKENFFQKIRIKFRELTGQLTYRFTGKKQFAGKSTADSRRQQPREDLRKHSRYREKDVEIDCVLTDDSYLMDSYDRKGEYRKLTTETGYREGNS